MNRKPSAPGEAPNNPPPDDRIPIGPTDVLTPIRQPL